MGKQRFLLLYGSETGQAAAIAEEVCERAPDYNLKAALHCLSTVDKKFTLENESVAVFVVSTTGEGEPPKTARKFYKRLKKTTLSERYLSHLKYCLLGLGDSNYDRFCKFGKSLDKRLKQLGATTFADSGFADDALGLEHITEPWIENLWINLQKVLLCKDSITSSPHILKTYQEVLVKTDHISCDVSSTTPSLSSENRDDISLTSYKTSLKDVTLNLPALPKSILKLQHSETRYDKSNSEVTRLDFPQAVSSVKLVNIKSAAKLTKEGAKKDVLELTLDLNNSGLTFQPGDCFGIVCENDPEEVQGLIDRLDLNAVADQRVHLEKVDEEAKLPSDFPSHSSIRQILLSYCDIRTVPKKTFIRLLAEHASDANEKRRLEELCSRQGSEQYSFLIRERSLSFIDILMKFASCKPPIARIIEQLPSLQARPYSVSNYLNPNTVRCVFTVVEIPMQKGQHTKRSGVCTKWLSKLTKNMQSDECLNEESSCLDAELSKMTFNDKPQIAIFKRASTGFHLPTDPSIPIVMICAGAGIAPFIGFLEQRHEERQSNPSAKNWLLFGCRNEAYDFLYKDEVISYQKKGTLDKFSLALSQSSTIKARYVQEAIADEAEEFIHWITDMKAIIYVCGDAKNMMKDVRAQIEKCLMEQKALSEEGAKSFVRDLQSKKLYLQDIWF